MNGAKLSCGQKGSCGPDACALSGPELTPDPFQKGSKGLAVKVGWEIILLTSLFFVYFPHFLKYIYLRPQFYDCKNPTINMLLHTSGAKLLFYGKSKLSSF